MAEQKAVAVYLTKHQDAIERFLLNFKTNILIRLERIFEGIQELKKQGYSVDAIAPQAAIYLTIKMDLVGTVTREGSKLENQADVTSYLLDEAKLAIVPFYAFGTSNTSPWYRLSVGTCKEEDIDGMLSKLKEALEKLSD
jgi:aspartate aminotransferase